MNRKIVCLVSVFVLSATILLGSTVAYAQQTPGQIVKFGPGSPPPLQDSIITEDLSGNIGIGTTTPGTMLDVAGTVNASEQYNIAGNRVVSTPGFNTFVGVGAGRDNTTGSNNTFFGYSAGLSNTGGCCNAFFGGQAGRDNTGTNNAFFGAAAGPSNTTGVLNSFFGYSAGLANTTGHQNAFFGTNAGFFNTMGYGNAFFGVSAGFSNTEGNNNTAIGIGAGFPENVGNLTNATAIGAGAIVNASNKIRLGNTAVTVIEGEVPYSFPSDKTKKENFKSVDGEEVLRKISRLSLTSWNYIGHDPKQFRHYGPVAQDFFAAFGDDGIGTIGTPTTINSGDMAGILMIAVKALERRTAEQGLELEKKTRELEAKNRVINDLSQRLEAMERLVKGTQTAMRESTK